MKNKRITILGISAYYHDSAASILVNGDIVAAASEERFSRIKGDSSFPHHAVGYCLEEAGIDIFTRTVSSNSTVLLRCSM